MTDVFALNLNIIKMTLSFYIYRYIPFSILVVYPFIWYKCNVMAIQMMGVNPVIMDSMNIYTSIYKHNGTVLYYGCN